MNEKLKEKTREALTSVLPITVIVLVLSVTLVPMEGGYAGPVFNGGGAAHRGHGLLPAGAEISMTPLGQGIGGSIVRQKKNMAGRCYLLCHGRYHHDLRTRSAGAGQPGGGHPQRRAHLTVAAGVGVFTAVVEAAHFVPRAAVQNAVGAVFAAVRGVPLSPMNFWPSPLMPAVTTRPHDGALYHGAGLGFRLPSDMTAPTTASASSPCAVLAPS